MPKRGVWCLEGPWTGNLTDKYSVSPLLRVLEHDGVLKLFHQPIANQTHLLDYLKLWQQKKYADYTIGYLGIHGVPGGLRFGTQILPLEEIAERYPGGFAGKSLYFGSCSVLRISDERILAFIKATGVRAIFGYRRDVGWYESTAFDLLLFEALSRYERTGFVAKHLVKRYPDLCELLGFVAFT